MRTKSCARFGLNFSIFLLCQKQKKIPESYRSAATTGPNSTKFRTNHPCVNGTSGFTNKGQINSQRGGYDFFLLSSGMIYSTMFIEKIKGGPRLVFYIIPCYVTMSYEKLCISSFDTMWRNQCIWSSQSCQLHVDFTFQLWFWPCIFRISMQVKGCCSKLTSLC